MITKGAVSARKLRGGYYTPDDLARIAVLSASTKARRPIRKILEPSVGDGGFLPAISQRFGQASISIVDINAEELVKAAAFARHAFSSTVVYNESLLGLVGDFEEKFDAAFGNPPFVRFQFLSEEDKGFARGILGDAEIDGVSNLWIPLMVGVLRSLRPGGIFGFVIPQEFLSTKSAKSFREFEEVEVLFPSRGAFAEILQDVVIITGRKASEIQSECFVKFVASVSWEASVSPGDSSWIPYLLEDHQRQAFAFVSSLPSSRELKSLAKFSVSTVTGANEYFCVNDSTRRQYELEPFTRPLLAKGSDIEGLLVGPPDVAGALSSGRPAWLFGTNLDYADLTPGAKRYVDLGVSLGLHNRYKCAIRNPWYDVPIVPPKPLLMSKRAHRHLRVVVNSSRLATTDTIYQGVTAPKIKPEVLAASFHSSFTMLSCELEGRSYGGGVLELIPSEIARLRVLTSLGADDLAKLDVLSRKNGGQRDDTSAIVKLTDQLLAQKEPQYAEALSGINSGWQRLAAFRHRGVGADS